MNSKESCDRLEEIIASVGCAVVQGTGTSMLPLIRNSTDRMLITAKKDRTPARPAIAVYRRGDRLIAHRILGTDPDGTLRIRGDNQLRWEHVSPDEVIGTVEGVYRGERYLDFAVDKKSRFLRRLWCSPLFPRPLLLPFLRRLSPLYRREAAYARSQRAEKKKG